jgi:hypothetical protein
VLLIGNASSRRTVLLRDALSRVPVPLTVIEWRDLLAPGGLEASLGPAALAGHTWCKIETPGGENGLDDLLIERGWRLRGEPGPRPVPLAHGELAHREWRFAGFADVLRQIEAPLSGLRLLNAIDDILIMCDKPACQGRLRLHGVPVPEWLGMPASFDAFEATHAARDFPAVFVKSRFGSSAAGVIALRRHPDGRLAAYSSARLENGRLYNHLGIRRVTARNEVMALVDAVLAQGAYVERWQPKSPVPGARDSHYDLRVVSLAGEPRQRLARISRSPLTNLHLGNSRAAPDWLSDIQVRELEDVTSRAAAAFHRSHTVGFDIGLGARGASVFEANAFGDLLPGLTFAGLSTYDDQARLVSADESA